MREIKEYKPMDERLKDDGFYDFFCDYYTDEEENKARGQVEGGSVDIDENKTIMDAMADKAYVDKVYAEYNQKDV